MYGYPYPRIREGSITSLSIGLIGQILFGETKPCHPLPKFVSGRWEYFNDGGSLTFPAHQFVSGGWDNRSMERKLASAMLVMGLLASSMTPASAIFGLSKCEKVKKQIKNELAIGDALFKAYRSSVYKIQPIKVTETYGEKYQKYESALNALTLVFESDIKAWGMAQKSPQCFSVDQNSAIRTALRTFKSSSAKINQAIAKSDIFAQFNLTEIYTGRVDTKEVFFSKKK